MILALSIMIKGNQVTLINVIGMFVCLVRILLTILITFVTIQKYDSLKPISGI